MRSHRICLLLLALLCIPVLSAAQEYAQRPAQVTLPPLALPVIEYRGELDRRVVFIVPGPEGSALFTRDSIILCRKTGVVSPVHADSEVPADLRDAIAERRRPIPAIEVEIGRISFRETGTGAKIEGLDEQPAKARYIVGNDPSKWIADVPTFNAVAYRDLWPGVTLTFTLDGGKVTCATQGADKSGVKIERAGKSLTPEEAGEMLSEALGGGWPLVKGRRVMYDSRNNAFLASTAHSPGADCFVARVDSPGKLAWITFIGGDADDIASAVSVDRSSSVYATGFTRSEDFPTTEKAYKTKFNGSQDYFTARLNASDGSLIYSSYLGLGGGGLGLEPFAAKWQGSDKLLAIMVDDGREAEQVKPLLDLGIPMTFAVMPWATPACIDSIRSAGSAIFLHAPMEALGSSNWRSEEISVGQTDAQIKELLESWMVLVAWEDGISNHRGSKATSDPETMKRILAVAKKYDLMFYDSNTSPVSIAVNVARDMGAPCLQQDLFLDDREVAGVRARVLAMAEIAERTGYSTCICHVGGASVPEALKTLIPELKARGFRFVTVPELYKALAGK